MATYYVKPTGNNANSGTAVNAAWATPEYAAAHQSTGDTVIFFAGTYYMSAAITGAIWTNVTWKTAGDGDVVFSGGVVQTGFSVYSGSIYRAAISGSKLEARNIYVNGKRYTRPRLGAGLSAGWSTNANPGYTTTDAFMATWGNKTDIELIYRYGWTESRVRVASISGNDITCNPSLTVYRAFSTYHASVGFLDVVTDIENAYEIFSSNLTPGTFYIDRANGYLYAIPLAGQDLTTDSVVIPILKQLLVADTLDSTTFGQGIVWSHTNYQLPNDDFVEMQENAYVPLGTTGFDDTRPYPVIPAAVEITKGTNMSVTRNRFEHLGGSGIHFHDQSQTDTVQGCTFKDLSGAGYYVGLPSEINPATKTQNITIKNNVIRRVGQEFKGAPGGKAFYSRDIVVSHNDVGFTPYSGITDGWGWGLTGTTTSQQSGGTYTYNKIYGAMQEMRDGGGLYFNNTHVSTVVNNNLIAHIGKQSGDNTTCGVYVDNHSSGVTVSNNVIHSVRGWEHSNSNAAPGNTFHDNFTDTSTEEQDGNSTYGTVTVSTTPLADSGLTGYGLEDAYKDIVASTLVDGDIPAAMSLLPAESFSANTTYTLGAEGSIMFPIKIFFTPGGGSTFETIVINNGGTYIAFEFYTDGNCYFGIGYPYNRFIFAQTDHFEKGKTYWITYTWKDSPDQHELFINGISIGSGSKGGNVSGVSSFIIGEDTPFFSSQIAIGNIFVTSTKLTGTQVNNIIVGNFSGVTKVLDLMWNGDEATQYDLVGSKAFVNSQMLFIDRPISDAYATYQIPYFDKAAPYARAAVQTDTTHITIYLDDATNIADASLAANEFTLSAGTVTSAVLDGAAKTIVLTKSTTADVTSVSWTAASAGLSDLAGNTLTTFTLTPIKNFVTSVATTGAAALAAMI